MGCGGSKDLAPAEILEQEAETPEDRYAYRRQYKTRSVIAVAPPICRAVEPRAHQLGSGVKFSPATDILKPRPNQLGASKFEPFNTFPLTTLKMKGRPIPRPGSEIPT